MDSDDEDVIFENSVLHQALQNIGVADIQTEPRLPMTEMKLGGEDNVDDVICEKERNKDVFRISSLISSLKYNPKVLEEMRHYYRHQTLQQLITSKLLSEEDRIFLQYFVEEGTAYENPVKELTAWNPFLICVLAVSVVLLNLLPIADLLLPWIALTLHCTPIVSALHLPPFLVTLVLLHIFWLVTVIWPIVISKNTFQKKVLSHLTKQMAVVQQLEYQAWELMYLERKCLRLIRESELVARGFTVASQLHLASRQTDSVGSWDRWCPELRKIMLTENISLMAELKKWVVKMMKDIPMICVDSDFSTLESLSLDHEISGNTESCSNPCPASQEHISGTEAAKSSEVVTPSKLSKSVDLLSIYISGYIRRLALCFHHDNFRDKTIDSYKVSRECIEKTHEAMAEVWMTINQQYTLYRALHKSDELAGAVEANGHGPRASKKSQIYNLYVCVNSLDLHLQALLHTTRELTTSLEGRVDAERRRQAGVVVEAGNDDGKVGCVTAEDEEQWTDVFKRIKLGLESCKSCYDESLKHLHSKLNKESVPSSQPAWRETSEASTKQSKLKVIPAEDPVIVDQVFEAMSEAVNEDVPEVRPRYTAEDRARIQEQREMMKRLRQELHAVVGHRAIFQREREERALARARGELGNHEDIQAALSPVIGQKPPVVAAGNELQGEESDRIPQPCVSEDSGNSEAYADLALLKQSVAGDANAYGCSSMTGTGSNSSSEDDVAVVSASTREAGAAKDARTDPIAAKCSHQNTAECSLNSQSEEDGKTFQHNLLLEKESLRHLVAHDMEAITSEETNRVEAGDEHRVSSTTAHSSAEGKDESGLHSAVTTPDRKDSALSVPSDFHGCLSHKYFVTCEPETTEVKNCTHWGKEGEACEVQDLMGYENVVPQHPPNIVGPDWPYSGPEEEAGEEEDPLIDNWVKISHQEMTSPGGSRMELIREKEINLAEVLQQARPAISSPDPNSSFSKSLAVMAAARARNFNSSLLQEEEFGDDGSGSEIETDESNE